MKMKVSFHTLGCKVNFAETSTLARAFVEAGFERAEGSGREASGYGEVGAHTMVAADPQAADNAVPAADVYVINSCSVTAVADKKCRNLASRLHHRSPDALVVVTGCYAQLAPERVAAIPGVDMVFGNDFKGDIVPTVVRVLAERQGADSADLSASATRDLGDLDVSVGVGAAIATCPHSAISGFFGAWSAGDRTRSFLKVQDGCDYKCAYCTIHYARGASRSLPIAEVVAQARRIAAFGVKEIVLTGINTGDFGRPTGESFIDLLRALDSDPKAASIERYRISSIEPNLLTDEIIDFCAASTRFQHHFHIPLQSGSDRILGLMRRRYTSSDFALRVQQVRRTMPDAFIGVDVIVGFPGETEEDFAATRALLEQVRPAQLHVFPYSERPGTPAATMTGKVAPTVSAARAAILGALSDELHAEFVARFAGVRAGVLFEAGSGGSVGSVGSVGDVAGELIAGHDGGAGDVASEKCVSGIAGSHEGGSEGLSVGAPRTMSGFTGNYIRVTVPYDPAKVNTVATVVLGA